ncbi:TonB-dependent receptor [Thalassomonas actiniarum]|uniref:TonB-dependent receptor n=1 Tax=Thalassomonas actiniarum TaxID=485447 RepID=A0AAE9YXF1_9GAMM|nr:TonB-dependent receptor [Thalassomonas actiniarum]WDE01352.1 TonB-dependent receptor [Thalassomonas actiniarum]
MKTIKKSPVFLCVHAALIAGSLGTSAIASAEEAQDMKLEVIEVTARKRVENVQEVPVSVSAMQGEMLDVYSSAGMDIRFMSAKIPSLSIESSFGRTFPRFYVRGLGNTDFDLNGSQPVSLVVDEVVQENPILKGFPVFDVERVEVLRGPQGTLFGRNTPAGLVKFDSKKPTQDFDGFMSYSYGTHNTQDFKGAVGFGLTDKLSTRVSLLKQKRDDYIDNEAPGYEDNNVLGGYDETAGRVQFLWEDGDFTALLNYHFRDLEAKPIVFNANLIEAGTNNIRKGFDDETVYQDAARFATQDVETNGGSLKLEYTSDEYVYTSITGYESAEIFSRADVDGGNPDGPGFIPFSAESADAIPDHKQITQEFRVTSLYDGPMNFQAGFFYYMEDLTIESLSYNTAENSAINGYAVQDQETRAWALFGSMDYQLSDDLKITTGLRYSADDKEFVAERFTNPTPWNGSPDYMKGEANPDDSHVSWDISANYKVSDDINWFGRIANSFRAPSIQGRILFGDEVTVADSETITSFETGLKTDVMDGRGRINGSVFYYTMDDQQLTAVGGDANFNRLVNAEETTGYGFELDAEFVVTENLLVTGNISYNNTEINDNDLSIAVCAQCTVTDPINSDGRAVIDGNSLPHAPEWIANFTARYARELGDGEIFIYTDWSYRSEVDFFLYKSVEFEGKSLLEGGLRTGYAWSGADNDYEVALFARNITDEQVVIGGVDFNNNTGIVNEGRFVGAEFKVNFF